MKPDKKAPPPKKTDGKIFDVSRPGKVPASPTSRPVIVGHKAYAQEAQTSVSGVGEARPLLTKSRVQIFPTSDKQAEKEPTKELTPKPAAEDKEPEADAQTTDTKVTPEEQEALAATALEAAHVGPPGYMDEKAREKLHTGPRLRIEPLPATGTENVDGEVEVKPAEAKPEPNVSEEPKAEEPKSEEPASAETRPEETLPEGPKPAEDNQAKSEIDGEKIPLQMSSVPDELAPAVPAETLTPSEEAEPDIKPLFDDSGVVVSSHEHYHHRSGLKVFLLILLIIVLAAVALDLVLDLGLLKLEGLPHTDFL
jgi:hypothetical protein